MAYYSGSFERERGVLAVKEKVAQILDYIIEYSLYILIFFIPIGKAPLQIFATIAFVAFVVKKILKPELSFLKSPLHYFLLAFVGFSALSLFAAGPLIGKALVALFFKWLKYLGIFLFFEDTINNQKRIRNALLIFFTSGVLVGVDGIFQKFSSIDFLRHWKLIPVNQGLSGVCASFNHYNDFGAYLIVILSLVIALSISGRLKNSALFGLIIIEVLLSFCLIFTFSRGAWLGFVCTLFLMFILSSRNMAKKLVFVIPVFIGIFILVPELKERILFTFTPSGDVDRLKVWHAAFVMIKESPLLGRGIGLFMDNFTRITPNLYAQYTHNCYLQIWAETGIFSLLSFLGFMILLLIKGIKVFKQNHNFLVLGITCGLFGFLVHSFFDTQFYSVQTAVLFWSMAGILNVIDEKQIQV